MQTGGCAAATKAPPHLGHFETFNQAGSCGSRLPLLLNWLPIRRHHLPWGAAAAPPAAQVPNGNRVDARHSARGPGAQQPAVGRRRCLCRRHRLLRRGGRRLGRLRCRRRLCRCCLRRQVLLQLLPLQGHPVRSQHGDRRRRLPRLLRAARQRLHARTKRTLLRRRHKHYSIPRVLCPVSEQVSAHKERQTDSKLVLRRCVVRGRQQQQLCKVLCPARRRRQQQQQQRQQQLHTPAEPSLQRGQRGQHQLGAVRQVGQLLPAAAQLEEAAEKVGQGREGR